MLCSAREDVTPFKNAAPAMMPMDALRPKLRVCTRMRLERFSAKYIAPTRLFPLLSGRVRIVTGSAQYGSVAQAARTPFLGLRGHATTDRIRSVKDKDELVNYCCVGAKG